MTDSGARAAAALPPHLAAGRIANSAQLRHRHLAELLWHLGEHGPASRLDVASDCQLAVSTLTDLVGELKRRQLVKELPLMHRRGRVGRPTQPIALDDDSPWCVLGVHISTRGVTSEIATVGGQIVGHRHHDASPIPDDADQLSTHLAGALRRHLTGLPGDKTVIAAGVALPGIVTDNGGDLREADGHPWNQMPVRERLTTALAEAGLSRLSVTVAGETQLEALHAARTLVRVPPGQTALYVGGGQSVSGAVIAAGQVQPGHHGAAGYLAHVPVGSDISCLCGRHGCLDTVASLPALLVESGADYAIAKTSVDEDGSKIDWLRGQAMAGAPAALTTLKTAGEALKAALQAACAVLDPDSVIIGGHLGGIREWLPSLDVDATVTYLDPGEADPVQGALLAAQDACLSEPLVWTERAPIKPATMRRSVPTTGSVARAEIVKIAIDSTGGRSAVVRDPSSPRQTHHHGLGKVGDPIVPFLGHRAGHGNDDGYDIVLPNDRASLYVYQVDSRGRGSGLERRLPWASLGAPDFPNRHALPNEAAS